MKRDTHFERTLLAETRIRLSGCGSQEKPQEKPGDALLTACLFLCTVCTPTKEVRHWPSLAANKLISPWPAGITACPVASDRHSCSLKGRLTARSGLRIGLSGVDDTGRLFREGKAAISAKLAGIFERLGSRAENWQARMEKLKKGRLYGCFFACSREKLREMAESLKVRRLVDLTGLRGRVTRS